MSTSRLDEAILASVGERWTKVAMVIVKVADAMADALPPEDDGYQIIWQRIEDLVLNGRLIAQGNIEKWRFSEVRRPAAM
jgi:hypothetical protein